MKKIITICLFLLVFTGLSAQTHRVLFKTSYGDFKVLLYDYTPKHRDLFLTAIKTGAYRDALFNRIIENFVIQGGEHDVDIAKREAKQPELGKPRLAGEFDQRAFHKVGAFGAGRDDNPEKASFLNQIYFVVGKPVTAEYLDELEQKKGITYSKEARETYLKIGGQPRLDNDYTVFGEVYEGLAVLLEMSRTETDKADYPVKEISFTVEEIK
ncbi:peptidylprolyl isomerase [Sphingobacterium deserti]|uniref:peptidylprolyl isomerase n=1 Tax=Sphingobacterium deserti TaxID=1229276 RepID=A0A0B8T655_9SPHI|nr:peptidylprolyl isomerase [Sphingobacterium deserti]KGE13349.1 peptidyl-prolyl cis-trans isomerase cyclophilin type [Sphingobacterium deserti]